MSSKNLKTLLFDIETAPSLGWVWGKYQQDVIAFDQNWYMLCWSAKWLDSSKIITKALPDYKGYKKNPEDDKALCIDLWNLIDEADIIIGHNCDEFDLKKANARFVINELEPPSPYRTIDTYKVARKHFAFESNKLDDLGKMLKVGQKLSTGGFSLWKGCMSGDLNSWKTMKQYNKQDVILLEDVYYKLRSWNKNAPRINEDTSACYCCGSINTQRRGFNYTKAKKFHRIFCKDCSSWSQGPVVK